MIIYIIACIKKLHFNRVECTLSLIAKGSTSPRLNGSQEEDYELHVPCTKRRVRQLETGKRKKKMRSYTMKFVKDENLIIFFLKT